MVLLRSLHILSCLCLCLFLNPSAEGFRSPLPSLSIDHKTLNELITPIIVGAVIGEMHSRAKKQKQQDHEASAQHHHPVFMPLTWQPIPRHPAVQQIPFQHHPAPHHILPLLHHHHHHHPMARFHPHPHVHPQPLPFAPPEMIPWIHERILANIIQDLQHPKSASDLQPMMITMIEGPFREVTIYES